MKTLIVLPMGAHPFHPGHLALYNAARQAFPDADVYVAATNDTSTRPFPFAVKEKLAKLAGVAPGRFVQVKSPFRAEEITSKYNPATDSLIFVRSEKDINSQPKPGGVKKDGSPSYLQPYTADSELAPFNQHAYMAYLPTVEFGPGMTSATQIRSAWPTLTDRRKTALVMSLYPRTQGNAKLAATVVKLLDAAIGGAEGVAEGLSESLVSKIEELGMIGRIEYMGPDYKMSYRATLQDKTTGKVWHSDFNDGKTAEDWLVDTLSKYEQWKNKQQGVAESKIQYGVLDHTNVNLIINKSESKPDGVYSFRGILFKVKGGKVTHYAVDGKILQAMGRFTTQIGSYSTNAEAKALLKSIKEGVDENQGWAATFTNEQTGQMAGTPAVGGMRATYQQRENQPMAEDYLEERRSTSS